MKFDKNLSAIHGYLCGDGYVIRNPETQKHKYYYIGFRNTNETLLRDFQERFDIAFGVKPIITNEGRCKVQNKNIYSRLTEGYSYYSYEWKLPELSKQNLKLWLRAFFDCEAWIENQPAKSRLIGLECCNKSGLLNIKNSLDRFGIKSQIAKRSNRIIWRLTICGLENLKIFQRHIGSLHPEKRNKLRKAINSYHNNVWQIPKSKNLLLHFIKQKGQVRRSRNEIRFFSVLEKNLFNLQKSLNKLSINSSIYGPWRNSSGSQYYCLIIRSKEDTVYGQTTSRSATRVETS